MASSSLFWPVEARIVRAAQEAMFPPDIGLPVPDAPERIASVMDDARPIVRLLVRLSVWALEVSPLLAHGARFTRMDPARRGAWLGRLVASERPAARSLGMAIRTLVASVVYDDPAVLDALGYDLADRRGPAVRRH